MPFDLPPTAILLVLALFRGRVLVPLICFCVPFVYPMALDLVITSGGDPQVVKPMLPWQTVASMASLVGLMFAVVVPVDPHR